LEYRSQRRGGVGVVDLNVKEEDFVTMLITANTHDDLLFFNDKGKAFQIKMYDVPEGKRATRGKSVMNYLAFASDEKVASVLAIPKDSKGKELSLMMITKNGIAKKVAAENFRDVRRSGIIAIKLKDGDELLSVGAVEKGDEIIMATASGQSIRFKESDVREMGRGASGVTAMRLKKGDIVVGTDSIGKDEKDGEFLVVSSSGYGKKTKLKEYKTQKRGGSGIKTMKVTGKTGKLINAQVVTGKVTEAVAISQHGQIIRTLLEQISSLGRQTQGVRIMKLREGDILASLTCL
jgi:DNA gyrase subunit A